MGGGSGLLCLRNTVALRIRVPPTFHPGPQLPTTAHGARPAPAHRGPAPHAICLLGQTTPPHTRPPSLPFPSSSSFSNAVSSPTPLLCHYTTPIPKKNPKTKQAQQLHGRYVLLFGAPGRQKEFGEMTQGGDGRAKCIETRASRRRRRDGLFMTNLLLHSFLSKIWSHGDFGTACRRYRGGGGGAAEFKQVSRITWIKPLFIISDHIFWQNEMTCYG